MTEFANRNQITIPKQLKKPQIIDFLIKNLSSEILSPFLFPNLFDNKTDTKKTIKKKNSVPKKDSSSSTKDLSHRLTTLEGQVQELIDQFRDLRTLVLKNIKSETDLTIQEVLQTANRISNNILTSLDKLRKELNPLGHDKIDNQIREFLKTLMEEGEIQLQEMKSEFRIQIRTDNFGGFKA